MRKYEAIDILKMYAQGHSRLWNSVLNECFDKQDIRRLVSIRYGLQAGMDDLVKQKISNEQIEVFYLRLIRSVENTVRAIIRKKHPLPNDNPLTPKHQLSELTLKAKRKRDAEIAQFLHDSAY